MKLIIIILVLLIAGCAVLDQKLNPDIVYRRDIKLNINGVDFDGVAVPKRANKYTIKLKAAGKIDVLTIRSCHREDVFNKPKGGFFSNNKKFKYEYVPVKGIEDGRSCLLDIGAFEEKRGRHSFASVDFEYGEENLPAIVKCGGVQYDTAPVSVSICQGRVGSLQKIIFDHRVKVSPDTDKCKVMSTENELEYTFIMPLAECIYYFVDKYYNVHKLTTVGYDGILVRGSND